MDTLASTCAVPSQGYSLWLRHVQFRRRPKPVVPTKGRTRQPAYTPTNARSSIAWSAAPGRFARCMRRRAGKRDGHQSGATTRLCRPFKCGWLSIRVSGCVRGGMAVFRVECRPLVGSSDGTPIAEAISLLRPAPAFCAMSRSTCGSVKSTISSMATAYGQEPWAHQISRALPLATTTAACASHTRSRRECPSSPVVYQEPATLPSQNTGDACGIPAPCETAYAASAARTRRAGPHRDGSMRKDQP